MLRLLPLPCLVLLAFLFPAALKAGGFSPKINTPDFTMTTAGSLPIKQLAYQQTGFLYASGPSEKEDSLFINHMRRKAKRSKFLGIGSIGGLLLSAVAVAVLPLAIVGVTLSLVAGITAIVIGKEVIDATDDRKAVSDAKFGLVTGTVDVVTIIGTAVVVTLAIIVAKVVAKVIGDFFVALFGGLR